jgi:hypothetical protein
LTRVVQRHPGFIGHALDDLARRYVSRKRVRLTRPEVHQIAVADAATVSP